MLESNTTTYASERYSSIRTNTKAEQAGKQTDKYKEDKDKAARAKRVFERGKILIAQRWISVGQEKQPTTCTRRWVLVDSTNPEEVHAATHVVGTPSHTD